MLNQKDRTIITFKNKICCLRIMKNVRYKITFCNLNSSLNKKPLISVMGFCHR